MGRPPRKHIEEGIFHVFTRGNDRQKIFHEPADYSLFLNILALEKARSPFFLHAHCLMPNHLHLLAQVRKTPLSTIMHRIKTRYARHFNKKRGATGHVFQGRYNSILCRTSARVLEVADYIHMNPVRAGLVCKPEDWVWSSQAAYLDPRSHGIVETELVLSLMDHFEEDASGESPPISIAETEEHRDGCSLFLGSPPAPGEPNSCQSDRVLPNPASLKELAEKIAKRNNVEVSMLLGPSRAHAISAMRKSLISEALALGLGPVAIGRFLGRSPSTVCRLAT